MVHETDKSNSGIHVDSNGDRVIGGSRRSDGSTRRVIKVREGYTPAEDTQRYNVRQSRESRAEKEQLSIEKPSERSRTRFSGLNGLLKANYEANESRKPREYPSAATKNPTKDVDSIIDKLSYFGLKRDETPTIKKNDNNSNMTGNVQCSNGTSEPTRTTSEDFQTGKKNSYRSPHQRKKKMTLEELNKSLGVNN